MNTQAKLTPEMEANKWRKGEPSPNPSGRPKRKPIEEALLRAITPEEATAVARAILKQAKRGNVGAFAAIRDTTDGRPAQQVELSGREGGPLELSIAETIAERRRRVAEYREQRLKVNQSP